jgi:hypothetical protein
VFSLAKTAWRPPAPVRWGASRAEAAAPERRQHRRIWTHGRPQTGLHSYQVCGTVSCLMMRGIIAYSALGLLWIRTEFRKLLTADQPVSGMDLFLLFGSTIACVTSLIAPCTPLLASLCAARAPLLTPFCAPRASFLSSLRTRLRRLRGRRGGRGAGLGFSL